MRWRLGTDPDRRQTVGELIYEIAQTQIAEQGLPTKAIGRWFPYVASLVLFIWVVNMLGFIPLPLSDETFELFGVELPTLGDLRRHVVALGHARARADDVRLHAHRRDPRERRRRLLQELDPRRAEGDVPADRPARDPRPVHAADLAVRPALREHARRPHADPHLHRPDLRARERRSSRRSSSPPRRRSTSSRS